MGVSKQHKAFRSEKIMPIDANNIILEQAFARLLVLVRTKGMPITSTTKDTLYPKDLLKLISENPTHFQGISNDANRCQIIEEWLLNEFVTTIKVGRGREGEGRIANLKPIHLSTIKLIDPRIRSQDRDLSKFLYNVFQDSDLIMGQNSLLLPYLNIGTIPFGEHDSKIDESNIDGLDIETLFLLRLLENFKIDKVNKKKKIESHDFICPGQRQLIINDTDLPPLFVPPLKLEFVFIQTVSATLQLSVSLQPFLEQVASIQAHYAVETYYTPYAIFQSTLLLQTTSQISHSLEAHREIYHYHSR